MRRGLFASPLPILATAAGVSASVAATVQVRRRLSAWHPHQEPDKWIT
jgi:hypothetical protein